MDFLKILFTSNINILDIKFFRRSLSFMCSFSLLVSLGQYILNSTTVTGRFDRIVYYDIRIHVQCTGTRNDDYGALTTSPRETFMKSISKRYRSVGTCTSLSSGSKIWLYVWNQTEIELFCFLRPRFPTSYVERFFRNSKNKFKICLYVYL